MPEHVSYRDVKNKYTVGYEIGQRADPHAIADRKPQAVTKLHTEPSRAASATLHLCVTRAHIAHGRAAARAAGTSGFLPRERGQARRQEATQEGAPPGEGGAVCFVFRCCAATASVVQLREVVPVEVTLASNTWAQLGKEARALHIRLLPAHRP